MSVVQLLPEAEQELEAAALHYESQQAGLGAALLGEAERAFGRISELPLAARAIRGDLRRRVVHRFPYYVLYRVEGDDILVVALRIAPQATGEMTMSKHPIFAMKFAKVYPLYIQKAERKNRTKEEVDRIICWLTGYDQAGLQQQVKQGNDFESFFAQAPTIHPNSALIKGVVCGVRVEEIEDQLMQKIRYLDKLIDELAKGKAMGKILRQ